MCSEQKQRQKEVIKLTRESLEETSRLTAYLHYTFPNYRAVAKKFHLKRSFINYIGQVISAESHKVKSSSRNEKVLAPSIFYIMATFGGEATASESRRSRV